ncbi:MAG: hypothetical protein MOGMAGMI_01729 [Candidatus Omnitrophica bacterium]|nr:hypothetical protein [Candidatus Omnitrophota bacterium]
MHILSGLRRTYALDPRSLALFRIGLGATLLSDLLLRLRDFAEFYLETGLLPGARVLAAQAGSGRWSLYLWSAEPSWTVGLWVLSVLSALCLLLGVKARAAAALSWVLLVSLHGRNPLVLQAGDGLLRLLVLWSAWLPIDQRWALRPGRAPAALTTAVGTAGLTLQVVLMYASTVILKSGRAWHEEASAVYYALSIEPLTTDAGRWLLSLGPSVTGALTRLAYWTEALLPVLLICPAAVAVCRSGAVLAGVVFHLALGMMMHLGLFPLIDVVSLLPFIPAGVWAVTGRSGSGGAVLPAVRAVAWTRACAAAGLVVIGLTFWSCLSGLRWIPRPPESVRRLIATLYLEQRWSMFAPYPLTFSGWYEATGRTVDGRRVNLIDPDRAPDLARPPERRPWYYRDQRWTKYMLHLAGRRSVAQSRALTRYLCRRSTERLVSADLYFVRRRTPSPKGGRPVWSRERLYRHRCAEDHPPG